MDARRRRVLLLFAIPAFVAAVVAGVIKTLDSSSPPYNLAASRVCLERHWRVARIKPREASHSYPGLTVHRATNFPVELYFAPRVETAKREQEGESVLVFRRRNVLLGIEDVGQRDRLIDRLARCLRTGS